MMVSIFSKPTAEKMGWQGLKTGDINDAIDYEYDKYWCGVGTFTLTIPVNSIFADKILINSILLIDNDGLIVKNIKRTHDKITITGYDLNGLLRDRITLYPSHGIAGGEGYDIIEGTTETCVKHFVTYNLIAHDDANRNIPSLLCAEDKGRGFAEDKNRVRLQNVEEVIRSMCESAELGYRVEFNTDLNKAKSCLCFDVYEKVDKSDSQDERNRVVFSVARKNITGIEREIGITADRNTLYCEADEVVTAVTKNGVNVELAEQAEKIHSGFDRREDYLSFSCELADLAVNAKNDIADKFGETDSLVIDGGNPLDFGTLYNLGDIVTVYDTDSKTQLDSYISHAKIKRSGGSYTVQLTLGDAKPKLLDGYAKKSDLSSRQQKEQAVKIPTGAGGITTTTKKILFKDGGFDLTFEDSNKAEYKNEFKVTVDSLSRIVYIDNLTDGRGITVGYDGLITEDPDNALIALYTPDSLDVSGGKWYNSLDNTLYTMELTGGSVLSGGGLSLAASEYAATPLFSADESVYIICKASGIPTKYHAPIFSRYNPSNSSGKDSPTILAQKTTGEVGYSLEVSTSGFNIKIGATVKANAEYRCYCMSRLADKGSISFSPGFFIDGAGQFDKDNLSSYTTSYSSWYINKNGNTYKNSYAEPVGVDVKMLAVFADKHDLSTIKYFSNKFLNEYL